MSALEETPTATDAAVALVMLPQLPYADAVHRQFAELAFLPDTVEAGMRRETVGLTDGDLFVRLVWLPGNDDLIPSRVRADGLVVQWSNLAGWSVECGEDLVVLEELAELADPGQVADVAMHAAVYGLSGSELPGNPTRWSQAHVLEAALLRYEEGPVTW